MKDRNLRWCTLITVAQYVVQAILRVSVCIKIHYGIVHIVEPHSKRIDMLKAIHMSNDPGFISLEVVHQTASSLYTSVCLTYNSSIWV